MSKTKRDSLAGKGKGANHEGTGRDYSKEKAYQSTPERKAYRAALNKKNRELGTYGNKDKKDVSHTKTGKTVLENQSANRARNGKKGSSLK